jgi:hypothetical protein
MIINAKRNNRAGQAFAQPRARIARKLRLRLALQPSIDILAHHVFRQSIALLDFALELLALSVDLRKIVIGELTPLLFDPASRLLPTTFDAVPGHRSLQKSKSASGITLSQRKRKRRQSPASSAGSNEEMRLALPVQKNFGGTSRLTMPLARLDRSCWGTRYRRRG